eukprot:CAMPEP_0194266340 /NCGR_PEP_ID=MMETSP0169-20130528/1278_1 /TAXON_ID=218684 /ORGANISM="Corethron pennatum, Strain L29A3" /LENGTH=64 /DNA_ID=CAMNT_0039007001 /DNA_START=489 /DNA_END=683 /DNA_ORIENTATION=-
MKKLNYQIYKLGGMQHKESIQVEVRVAVLVQLFVALQILLLLPQSENLPQAATQLELSKGESMN